MTILRDTTAGPHEADLTAGPDSAQTGATRTSTEHRGPRSVDAANGQHIGDHEPGALPAAAPPEAASPKTGDNVANASPKNKGRQQSRGWKRPAQEIARGVKVGALSRMIRKNPEMLLLVAERALRATDGQGARMVEALQREIRAEHKVQITVTAARRFLQVLRGAGLLKQRKAGNKYRWSLAEREGADRKTHGGSGPTTTASAKAAPVTQNSGQEGDASELGVMAAAHKLMRPLSPNERSRVLGWLNAKLLDAAPATAVEPIKAPASYSSPRQERRPALAVPGTRDRGGLGEMSRRVKPQTEAERILVAAYYLTTTKQVTSFVTRDLSGANKEAGLKNCSNAAGAVRACVNKGWLSKRGKNLTLTAQGRKRIVKDGA